MQFSADEGFAKQLDAEDPLRSFRDKFYLPLGKDGRPLIYFAGDSLAITSWGGAYQMSQRKAFFEPYAKATGTKITEEEYTALATCLYKVLIKKDVPKAETEELLGLLASFKTVIASSPWPPRRSSPA